MTAALGAQASLVAATRGRWVLRLRPLVLLCGLVSCRRGGGRGAEASDATTTEPSSSPPPLAALLPARCRATPVGFSLDDARPGRDEVEVGDALAYPQGYAIGFVHRTSAGRVAAVALLHLDATRMRVVELGPTLGDAPPPHVVWRYNELVAAEFALHGAGARPGDNSRELSMYLVESGQVQKPYLSLPQAWDDSLAFDLAFAGADGLVVWDEATARGTGSAGRGVIRAAPVEGDQHGPVKDVSPPESDAEAPRVVSLGSGFIVTWLARRSEPTSGSDGASASEATGEPRAYGWLEAIALDAHGNPTGPLRRLTSAAGHVSAYDVLRLSASLKPQVLVVARDDGEAVDGSGGGLLRVRVGEDGAEAAAAFPCDGLGRGAPTFTDGPAPWLSWVGPREQLRLLPLDREGVPLASPSGEDAFDESRPLAMLSEDAAKALGAGDPDGGPGRAPAKFLVATPNDPVAAMRIFACAP